MIKDYPYSKHSSIVVPINQFSDDTDVTPPRKINRAVYILCLPGHKSVVLKDEVLHNGVWEARGLGRAGYRAGSLSADRHISYKNVSIQFSLLFLPTDKFFVRTLTVLCLQQRRKKGIRVKLTELEHPTLCAWCAGYTGTVDENGSSPRR